MISGEPTTLAEAKQIVAQQAAQITEQAAQITELQALVEGLRAALGQNSSNSSKPPSSDSPSQREKNRAKRARKASQRKRGGQPGHKGHQRAFLPADAIDEIKNYRPEVCVHCGLSVLQSTCCETPKIHQVVDLSEKGGVVVVEYRRHGVCCERCGEVVWAELSAQIPAQAFGPRLRSIVAMLTGVYHLSRRHVKRLLFEIFGIRIALGTISNIERRISGLLKPVVAQAKAIADAASVKHTDGTSWYQCGKLQSLWTVATQTVTVFSILADGCAPTLQTLFERLNHGILVSDRAKAINFWSMKKRQICWAHLLRKFVSFSEREMRRKAGDTAYRLHTRGV